MIETWRFRRRRVLGNRQAQRRNFVRWRVVDYRPAAGGVSVRIVYLWAWGALCYQGVEAQNAPELEAVTIYVTIYMPLLDEGTDVLAPVEAEDLKSGRYRIVGGTSEDQQWAFPTGPVVRCAPKIFANGESRLVAVEISN